jgi:hypothetical protein
MSLSPLSDKANFVFPPARTASRFPLLRPALASFVATGLAGSGMWAIANVREEGIPPASEQVEKQRDLGRLPLYLIENRGQLGDPVRYYVQTRDTFLYSPPRG